MPTKRLSFLDIFLPAQLLETVKIQLLYRARIVVGINLILFISTAVLLVLFIFLNVPRIMIFADVICSLALVSQLFFLKIARNNWNRNLLYGSTLQIVLITSMIYFAAFAQMHMGFFGLIWLGPIFLMIAFYFNTRYSFYFAIANLIAFLGISYIYYDRFFEPITNRTPSFSITYVVYLLIAMISSYLMAFFFVHLNEDLQSEVLKQRDLLLESAKFQSLGQMASNLAHDINNPLFTIQGKLHQMRNLLSRDQLDLERCDQIVESAELTLIKLSQIVKGISTFAREGRGDQMISISIDEFSNDATICAS